MRVLVSIQQDVFGGPHNQWLRIRDYLAQRGVDLVFLVPGESPEARERLEAAGGTVVRCPTPRLTLKGGLTGGASLVPQIYRSGREVAELARSLDIDCIVAAGIANLPAAVAAREARTALVWQLLSVFAPLYVRIGLGVLVAGWSGAIMTVGSRARAAHPSLALARSKVIEFFPPVDLEEFAPGADVHAPTERSDELLLVTVGNHNPHKGHDLLWAACSRLWQEGHRLRVRVVGQLSPSYAETYDRELVSWLASLTAEQRERVEYVSPSGSVARYLRDADIFVLPSRSEGVPTALLEAMAAGLPAVAFDVGGVAEVLRDGVEGLIASTPDADNLVATLRTLCTDASLRRSFGQAARHRAEEEFSIEQCGERHLEALQQAVQRRRL